MNPVLFLDRDGTINVDLGGGDRYVSKPEMIEMIPNAAQAILLAKEAGFKIALITNQAGIAKGITQASAMPLIHSHMEQLIHPDFQFDDIQVCPHKPENHCLCRKPRTKLLEDSVKQLNADISKSWFIGDHIRDLQTAAGLKIKSILVRTGNGSKYEQEALNAEASIRPKFIANDLHEAVRWILALS